ncbi:MAG: hypothetical protein J6U42_07935 [Lachnospiraceae bacterium]|nr:hypothetical protein [Lachnospiraceae bacterium]
MAENRTLLSQSEIDALVSFLQQSEQTDQVAIGDVLDQSSIDKLVDIIRFNNNHGVFLNGDTTAAILSAGDVDITAPDGTVVDRSACELEYKISDTGMAEIYCLDTSSFTAYKISPDSLKQRKYVAEGTSWGRAVSPRHFNKVANLFRLEYSQETFNFVIRHFAEVMYGDPNADVSKIYFPVEG